MDLTITLEESLAGQLREDASARHLSPEQAAHDLLSRELRRLAEAAAWDGLNARRVELLRKSRAAGLDPAEAKELADLQAAVDRHLAPVDKQLLAEAERFRQLAEQLPDATP